MTDLGSAGRRIACAALLKSALARVRAGRPLGELAGPALDAHLAAEQLRPIASTAVTTESLAINGERLDAVLTSGEAQWRVVFGSSSGATIDWLDVYKRPDRFDGFAGGRAIVLNGPSGAGKSTLMRALQQVVSFPLVVLDEPEHIGAVQPEGDRTRHARWRNSRTLTYSIRTPEMACAITSC